HPVWLPVPALSPAGGGRSGPGLHPCVSRNDLKVPRSEGAPGLGRTGFPRTAAPRLTGEVCLPHPLRPQRRQWLQEAMSAAFRGQREEVEQMKSCLRVLSQPTPPAASEAELASDLQEREGALELLADLCENMDNAAGTRPGPPRAPSGPAVPFRCGSRAPSRSSSQLAA
ncbi:PREDICTED: hsp70-binding protein 1-like, partial [Condylura cristata]|uniref:hsp70-binding protein 1-like n=1 Tax=Condylura cristata TaxID=143302 RepID=UPI0006434A43